MGVIPRDKVERRAEQLGVDIEQAVADVRAMDGAYLDYVKEQRELEEEQRKREAEREKAHGQRRGRQR